MPVNLESLLNDLVDYAEELIAENKELTASLCVELALLIMRNEAHTEEIYEKAVGLRSRLVGRAAKGIFGKLKDALLG